MILLCGNSRAVMHVIVVGTINGSTNDLNKNLVNRIADTVRLARLARKNEKNLDGDENANAEKRYKGKHKENRKREKERERE